MCFEEKLNWLFQRNRINGKYDFGLLFGSFDDLSMKTLDEQLLDTFSAMFTPTHEETDAFVALATPFEFSSKERIVDEHSFDKVFYLTDGMARSYIVNSGKDYTVDFFTKGQFILDWDSFDKNIPSVYQYETIFPMKGYFWHRKDIQAYLRVYPHLKKCRRFFAEAAYIRQAHRLIAFQSDALKDRYRNLIQNHGKLINTAPQYHIASYLGVKPQSLSRIKTALLNNKDGKDEVEN